MTERSQAGSQAPSLFLPRSLAAPDSLAGHLMAGATSLELPVLNGHPGAPRRKPESARLGSDAFGTSGPEAAAKLDRVLNGEGYFVTTGHQPILFLGPLYVLHKAVTAIELAAYLERTWKTPVVPLFWIAADDHDWAEVGSTSTLDAANKVVTLSVGVPDQGSLQSVGPTPLDPSIQDLIARLSELVAPSQYRDSNLEFIRTSYGSGGTYSGAFADLLHATLGERDYAWLDSAGSQVKQAAVPLYARMLEDPKTILGAQSQGNSQVLGAGFEPAIGELPNALPLFVDAGQGRVRLFVDEDGARAGRDGAVDSLDIWQERLETDPSAFSPNVSSRPVLESYLLPVAATVLGPGEISYWSQLPALFETLQTPLPWIQPRAAWNIVEPNVRRSLDRLGLDLETLADGGEEAIRGLTAASRPEDVDQGLEQVRASLEETLGGLEAAIAESLPGLKGAVGKTRKGIFGGLDKLERQVNQQTRSRLDVEVAQVRRCADNLFPDRKPQERLLSPLPYLARHGPRLIEDLAEQTARWIESSLASPIEGD